ncbi:unnamed protein product [Closterium sp. NIES-54]
MHSHLIVSGLPRSLPPLPPSLAPPCLPCVEGRQRTTPHSSFSPTTAPLQTLYMDVWGPARVSGQGRERHFLLVVDNFKCYTTVFPLRSKGEVPNVLIPWIRVIRLQLRECFGQDLPILRLHSDRGVMEVARTFMIHATAPPFLWSFAVRVSLPETSPTLRWTGKVGDASVFRVWGSRAFVRDTSADKLSACAIPCVFLGFTHDVPGWQFYHPTSRCVFHSQDVTFDESVPFFRLFPYPSAPPLPPPLFLAPGPPPEDPLPCTAPFEVAVRSGAARGAVFGGDASGGAEPGSKGAESGGAEPQGASSSEGPAGASPRLSPQQLREWLVRRARLWSGATGAGGAGAPGAGGASTRGTGAAGTGGVGGPGVGDPTEPGASGAGGFGAGGAGARGAGAGGNVAGGGGAGGAGVGGTGAEGAGPGTVRPRPYFVHLLQEDLGVPSSTSLTPPLLCPPPDQSQLPLQLASPLPSPSPYTEHSGDLTQHREPASRPVSPVRTARRIPRLRPPPIPGTHAMALRPSSVPLRVPLPAPSKPSLPAVPDRESDRARAASPTVSRLLATVVTDPSFESTAASALVAELLEFAVACRLDYATALVAESAFANPPSVTGECALGTDVLEDRQEDFEYLATAVPRFAPMLLAPEGDPDALDIPTPRSYAEAITGPYSSQWQAAMGAEMASWKSTGTYVDEVPPPGANIIDVSDKVDYFQTFFPTPKMTTLWVLLHVADQRDYELHSLDFSTAFLQGSLHEEIWLRRPPGFTGSFPTGTQCSPKPEVLHR